MKINSSRDAGIQGERTAVRFLKEKGFLIRAANWKCSAGEIDIVASEFSGAAGVSSGDGKPKDREEVLVFIEVKVRNNVSFADIREAVDERKQERIIRAALCYIKKHVRELVDVRFDCVLISPGNIEHIEDAFGSAFEYSI